MVSVICGVATRAFLFMYFNVSFSHHTCSCLHRWSLWINYYLGGFTAFQSGCWLLAVPRYPLIGLPQNLPAVSVSFAGPSPTFDGNTSQVHQLMMSLMVTVYPLRTFILMSKSLAFSYVQQESTFFLPSPQFLFRGCSYKLPLSIGLGLNQQLTVLIDA